MARLEPGSAYSVSTFQNRMMEDMRTKIEYGDFDKFVSEHQGREFYWEEWAYLITNYLASKAQKPNDVNININYAFFY